jgi:hypothetical protein
VSSHPLGSRWRFEPGPRYPGTVLSGKTCVVIAPTRAQAALTMSRCVWVRFDDPACANRLADDEVDGCWQVSPDHLTPDPT